MSAGSVRMHEEKQVMIRMEYKDIFFFKKAGTFCVVDYHFKKPHSQFRMMAKTLYYQALIIEQLFMEEPKDESHVNNGIVLEQQAPSPSIQRTYIIQSSLQTPLIQGLLAQSPPSPTPLPVKQDPAAQSSEGVASVLNHNSTNCKEHQQNQAKSQQQNKISKQIINQHLNLPSSREIMASLEQKQPSREGYQNIGGAEGLRKKRKSQRSYLYDSQENSEEAETYKFPFLNLYLKEHSNEYLKTMQAIDAARQAAKRITSQSFINCDVRYFNWQLFTEEVGKFQVVLIDPPWRIKGAQQNDSQFMFSNCKFSLEYNTMANSQISRIPLHLLSDRGFIFLWILNSQLDASLEIMEKWGYELVEEVVWVKLKDEKINLTHGYYFMHSYEVCLVGYKKAKNAKHQPLLVRSGISWNTIFAEVREKSQKPEDVYAVVDVMFKSARKIEIFARNHNLRFGIFSVGNELGESYDKWLLKLECDQCQNTLKSGFKRFKSKNRPNYDLCQKCIGTKDRKLFFELANDVDENVRHEYVSCNHCGNEPIWGIRFQCITCHDFDLCQNCYDKNLHQEHNFHPLDHQYLFLEVPVFGNGFHIHEFKCSSCYQNPIIGIYFSCSTCKSFKLCQKCYFQRPASSYTSLGKRHKPSHQLQVVFQPQVQADKRYQCFACKRQVLENCWMCQNCYNFFFCEKCFASKNSFKSLYANTHKQYHVLTKIF